MNAYLAITFALSAGLLAGCSSFTSKHRSQTGESVVFVGENPAALAYPPIPAHPVSVRGTYRPAPGSTEYVEGRDYAVDFSTATIRRLPGSLLPDFRTNVLFGRESFNHTEFPGFGNGGYFAFVDYSYRPADRWPVQALQTKFLKSTRSKLNHGRPLKIVAFGDSITAGGDASSPGLIFWQRWADHLQRAYPKAHVSAVNGATGGDSSVQGMQRLQTKVIDEKPDLVLVGFGMNDHNVSGVPIPDFKNNLKEIIRRIRQNTSAEVVLFSAFPPNPKWKFGTHRMEEYAAATACVASEMQCAYADVFTNWQMVATRKKPEDLLGNNINHPNDFGHWIYFQVLCRLGL